MPLAAPALKSQLSSAFANPPPSHAACAQAWASAVQAYASGIVPPSTTVAAAAAVLAGSLATAFQSSNAAPAMESAFAKFAGAVGLGMAGYVPTPPPGQVGFAAQFSGPKPATHAAAGEAIGGLIDMWMRTGLSTLAAPPGTVVPWS
jgi:hypothetical protein